MIDGLRSRGIIIFAGLSIYFILFSVFALDILRELFSGRLGRKKSMGVNRCPIAEPFIKRARRTLTWK